MQIIYLGLGSNVGSKEDYLQQAEQLIAKLIGNIVEKSRVYSSEPWGLKEQPSFLNSCLKIESQLSAEAILKAIEKIDNENQVCWISRVGD